MALNQNQTFKSSSNESTSTSMISSTGLTINNQIIGGLHSYPLLANITNGHVNNQLPLISSPGGTTTSIVPTAGCDPSNTTGSVCLATEAAIALPNFQHLSVGDEIVGACGAAPDQTINIMCEYQKEVTITSPVSLTLNPDLHSSGRLQLGMIVYIQEKSQAYQFMIDNYTELYNEAETAESIITSEYNSAISGDTPAGEAFINSWTVSKIEGEDNGIGGVWTRDEANWKKYPNQEEYFSINNVPASESIDDFNFEDAIIVVPDSWNNKKVTSVVTSISTHTTNIASTISLNHTPPTGPASKLDWTHATDSKTSSSTFSEPLLLQSGAILNLSQTPKFGSVNLGYSATFKVEG